MPQRASVDARCSVKLSDLSKGLLPKSVAKKGNLDHMLIRATNQNDPHFFSLVQAGRSD
jgi:hypothetical protein